MSDKSLVKKEIINNPDSYFHAQKKKLDAQIAKISLSSKDEEKIVRNHVKKFVRDKALGIFSLGEIVSEIINWNDSIEEDIKQAKKEYLLMEFFSKVDENEEAISSLKQFLSNPHGNTLFNKTLNILDNTPPDKELLEHLSNALKHMVGNNFHELFERHKYALSQIELLTPQALSILSDNSSWPIVGPVIYVSAGKTVSSDWSGAFTSAYCRVKEIDDLATIHRVKHSVKQLISNGLIEAIVVDKKTIKCEATQVGATLQVYILGLGV